MPPFIWQVAAVKSPHLSGEVSVIVARNLPYLPNAHRFQTLNIYLPHTTETGTLVDHPVDSLPASSGDNLSGILQVPKYQVHIHGGAWRDPNLTAESIEAEVASAFSDSSNTIQAVISLNYSLTHFPKHLELPYHTILDNRSDPSRDARHPDHIRDILNGFERLRKLGLKDDEYVLTGHSAGACLAFQAALVPGTHWGTGPNSGFSGLRGPPRPAALIGMNGLYDIPSLVYGLGPSHAKLRDVYAELLSHAFSPDETGSWPAASPAHFDCEEIGKHVRDGKAPKLVVLGQSTQDQLVPMNQRERMALQLNQVDGMAVTLSDKCTGTHAAPWEQGYMIWETVKETLNLLQGS